MLVTNDSLRGLDFGENILVVNYTLPTRLDAYILRIGKASRFGSKGAVINFVQTLDESKFIREIEDKYTTHIKEWSED